MNAVDKVVVAGLAVVVGVMSALVVVLAPVAHRHRGQAGDAGGAERVAVEECEVGSNKVWAVVDSKGELADEVGLSI